MRIIIAGGGEIAYQLASRLTRDHDVVVVEEEAASLTRFERLDLQVAQGSPTHPDTLRRLGLAAADDPVRIEDELSRLFPRERWTMLSHLLIFHGRRTCDARRPRCEGCALRELCPSAT